MSTTNIHFLQFKFKFTCKNAKFKTLNGSTSGLIPKRNGLKFLILHLPVCLIIRKNTHTEFIQSTVNCTCIRGLMLHGCSGVSRML